MGIRKASRATIPEWTAADLEIEGDYGSEASKVDWSAVYALPPREGEVEIIDGDSVSEKAEILVQKLFAEKVI
jgi:electron transfer flavoprotein alpha/beta subunit